MEKIKGEDEVFRQHLLRQRLKALGMTNQEVKEYRWKHRKDNQPVAIKLQ